MKKGSRNWADLPPEMTTLIFVRLSVVDILESAQKVCKSWRRISKDPLIWKKIDMRKFERYEQEYDYAKMCCHAVDRSQGGLLEISINDFCTDDLLNNIADRSSNLKCLRLEMHYSVTRGGFLQAIAKLPTLEELEVSHPWRKLILKDIGHSCRKLKTLKLICTQSELPWRAHDDSYAREIAESMPELRHLQLFGDGVTNAGLNTILDNCSHLEHLDVRQSINVQLVGDLEKRCSERIKVLRRPHDSTEDCQFKVGFDPYPYPDDGFGSLYDYAHTEVEYD